MSNNALILTLMAEQRRRWEEDDFVRVEDYLQTHAELQGDDEAILDLICNEIMLRQELAGSESVRFLREEYLRRFPQYRAELLAQQRFDELLAGLGTADAEPEASNGALVDIPGYRVVSELGRGGMGVVYRALQPSLERVVALKLCNEAVSALPEGVAQFRREAQALARLQHPAIVPVYDLGSLRDGRPFFTMQLIAGESLQTVLARRRNPTERLLSFLRMFQVVAEAIALAHDRGIVHGDLKPGNIMVGAGAQVHVVDWGLGKLLHAEDALSLDGGTAAYLAPERLTGAASDQRTDVFGLGAILCEILTGQPAYVGRADECRALAGKAELGPVYRRLDVSGADRELVALARSCLARRAEDRPTDGGAVAGAVSRYLLGLQDKLHRERRLRRLAVALAATVVLLVVTASTAWVRRAETEAVVRLALDNAETLRATAQQMPTSTPAEIDLALARWRQCEAAVKEAETALTLGTASPALRERVARWRTIVDTGLRAAGDR